MNSSEQLRELPVAELLKRLSTETAELVSAEIRLARAELATRGKAAGVGIGALGASGVLALGAFGALTATLILLLALAIPAWAAALAVTIVYGIVAAVLVQTGRKKIQAAVPPTPETAQTLKEDVAWAKSAAKTANR